MTRKIKHDGYTLYECAPEVPDELCYQDDDEEDNFLLWFVIIIGSVAGVTSIVMTVFLLKAWLGQ